MKRLFVLLLLVVLITLGTGSCRGIEPAVAPEPPEPGEWIAPTSFGQLIFTVNPDGTGISEVFFGFEDFTCAGVTYVSGGVGVESSEHWPVAGDEFNIEAYLNPWNMIVEGQFDKTGRHASGTWEITDTDCSGDWEASPSH